MKNNSNIQLKSKLSIFLIGAVLMLGISQATYAAAEKNCPSKVSGQATAEVEGDAVEEAEDAAASECGYPKCEYIRSHVNCRENSTGTWTCRASGSCG